MIESVITRFQDTLRTTDVPHFVTLDTPGSGFGEEGGFRQTLDGRLQVANLSEPIAGN